MLHPLPPRFRRWLAIAAVVIPVAATWPLALHLRDHVVDGARLTDPEHVDSAWAGNIGADVLLTTWVVNWDLHALVTQPLHLFDANIFYPAPLALARSEHLFGIALLAIPGRLIGGPVAAHQGALLLSLALNVCGAGYVVARWTGSTGAALVAGLLLAASPFHQSSVEHIQSIGTGWLPAIVFALERFAATGGVRWAAIGAGALVLQMLSGQYLAYYALVAWMVTAAVALATRTGPVRRMIRDAAVLAAASAAAALLVLPFVIPYLRVGAELPSNSETTWIGFASVPTLVEYLAPSPRMYLRLHDSPAVWLLALLGVIALVAGDRLDRTRVAALLLVGLAGALLSLGPDAQPFSLYRIVLRVLPGFRTMRGPYRASVLVFFALALLGGCGAGALLRRLPRVGPPLVFGVAALACAGAWRGPTPLLPLRVGPDLPDVYRFLARCGGGDPLLELPAYAGLASWLEAERVFYSTAHWLPLLNGRTGYPPAGYAAIATLGMQLPDAEALATLRAQTAVRWVLVHCERQGPGGTPSAALCGDQPPAGMLPAGRFGATRLYDLGRAPALPRPFPARWTTPADCGMPPPGATNEPTSVARPTE